jgi:hypothetical protein
MERCCPPNGLYQRARGTTAGESESPLSKPAQQPADDSGLWPQPYRFARRRCKGSLLEEPALRSATTRMVYLSQSRPSILSRRKTHSPKGNRNDTEPKYINVAFVAAYPTAVLRDGDMKQIHRRLAKLSECFSPTNSRTGTLEEFCRRFWRQDEWAVRRLVERECPGFRVLVTSFEHEDAERLARRPRCFQSVSPRRLARGLAPNSYR